MNRQTRRAAHRKPRGATRRGGSLLTGTGLVVAVWFGMTAPSVSPVASPAPTAHTVVRTALTAGATESTALSHR